MTFLNPFWFNLLFESTGKYGENHRIFYWPGTGGTGGASKACAAFGACGADPGTGGVFWL